MDKRTQNQVVAESVGEAVKEEAADIVAMIPVVGKALSKAVTVAQKADEKVAEKKKGMEKQPRFMQSVKFICKKNQIISSQQYSELKLILQKDYESLEKESLADIEYFIDAYVAGEVRTECSEDCVIGDDFLWIHLDEFEQFLYDGECLQKTLDALNTLLREEVFERFEAWGHDEDYRYD